MLPQDFLFRLQLFDHIIDNPFCQWPVFCLFHCSLFDIDPFQLMILSSVSSRVHHINCYFTVNGRNSSRMSKTMQLIRVKVHGVCWDLWYVTFIRKMSRQKFCILPASVLVNWASRRSVEQTFCIFVNCNEYVCVFLYNFLPTFIY